MEFGHQKVMLSLNQDENSNMGLFENSGPSYDNDRLEEMKLEQDGPTDALDSLMSNDGLAGTR